MNVRLFATLALAGSVPLFGAAPADLIHDLRTDLRTPALGSPAAVNNLTFAIGHLKLHLASGSAAVVTAAGEPAGFFFKGNGTFEYVAADPEMAVVTHNVKADSHAKLDGTTISDEVTEALVLFAGEAMPVLSEEGGAPLADAYTSHQALFARARIKPGWHLIAAQKLGLPGKAAFMELATSKDTLVYTYDSADLQEETLASVHSPGLYVSDKSMQQWLFPTTLSSQPIGRDPRAYARPLDTITHLDYTLIADGDDAKLEVTETIAPRIGGQKALRFDLDTEVYVAANKPVRHINVASITDDQGRALSFSHDTDSLLVALAAPASQPFKLKFVIDGDFLVREGGDNAWQLANIIWYPRARNWAGNFFTVHSVVKVKKPFIPIASGDTVVRKEEGDYTVVENATDKPIDFPIVEGGKYNLVEEKRGDLTIRVWSYGMRNDRAAKQLTNLAYAFIDYYQYFLGPFPWREFNIIQVNTWGYGQAPDATMFITNEAFVPASQLGEDDIFSEGINERFAHEIAHQYWGHVVKAPSPEEEWLRESFAEYSAALLMKKLKNQATYNRMTNSWRSYAKAASAVVPIPYANRIGGDPIQASNTRTHLLYSKGPALLAAIHKKVGDETFLTFLKSYQKSFAWRFGTTNDVAGLLSFITKEDWKPFFEQNFWDVGMPK